MHEASGPKIARYRGGFANRILRIPEDDAISQKYQEWLNLIGQTARRASLLQRERTLHVISHSSWAKLDSTYSVQESGSPWQ
jgi:hypothetical protein